MRRSPLPLLAGAGALLAGPPVRAGMPFVVLSDLAAARLEAISFFLLLFVLVTFGARRLWNGLAKEFPALPALSVRGAFGLVGLWSLALYVVLSMIAGGRELMTPGAWERKGATYKVTQTSAAPDERLLAARRLQLERLRRELWAWAAAHGGAFPPNDLAPEIPPEAWRVPDPSGIRYGYLPGLKPDAGSGLVAYEPPLFGRERLVLRADGEIALLPAEAFRAALAARGTR